MARYTITHSCGHQEDVQIYGTNTHGERERKAERMAKSPCKECRRRAELDAAAAWEREAGIGEGMQGSDKQVAWARSIRHAAMADVLGRVSPDARQGFAAFIATKPAAYWIDSRPSGMDVARKYAATMERS